MKKLNKIHIIPEKLIKPQDLIRITGGYDGYAWTCEVRESPGGSMIDENFQFQCSGCGVLGANHTCAEFYRSQFPSATCDCT